jgi:hypothetical protein
MAAELECDATTGTTVYFQVRNSVGLIWSTVAVAFEAYQTAHIANYNIAAAEQGSASGYFTASMPAAVAGEYNVIAKQQAGGSPAETDRTIASGNVHWTGTAIIGAATVLTAQMTESYRAAGVAPSLAQAIFELIAGVLDHSISGTTKTIRNIAGTAAKTYTLDSSTAPTSITETT